jgi:hypothetical protein
VSIERDRLRVSFADPRSSEPTATSLLIQWPTPFSKGFSERAAVEGIILKFIQPRERS